MPHPPLNILRVAVDGHSRIFDDLAGLLSDHFNRLGLPAASSVNQVRPDHLNIVVGQTLLLGKSELEFISKSGHPFIVYQAEALGNDDGFLGRVPDYLSFLFAANQVWDYSETNLSFLAGCGLRRGHYVPLGYSSRLQRIVPAEKDIDVLFFGANSPRRNAVLQSLTRTGIGVKFLFNVYGAERDQAIGRAKIVLNIHQFAELRQLEQVRISYLLNNRCFVLSETADCNPYGNGIVFCEYDDLAERCRAFLQAGMESERELAAERGLAGLREVPMLESIRKALAGLGEPRQTPCG
jgi:hypothetical protein